jgi:hypothetical protein
MNRMMFHIMNMERNIFLDLRVIRMLRCCCDVKGCKLDFTYGSSHRLMIDACLASCSLSMFTRKAINLICDRVCLSLQFLPAGSPTSKKEENENTTDKNSTYWCNSNHIKKAKKERNTKNLFKS